LKELLPEEAWHLDDLQWIDVRSPGEFEEATVPGAVNVPLFTDEERALIGTLYKQQGREPAVQKAMEIVSPKIPSLVNRVLETCGEKTPLIFCWRGGMRSKAMASFLDLAQQPAFRLTGGYRAYREMIVDRLEHYSLSSRLIVLHGLTGAGKTDILRRLEQRGIPVLDLESLAGHRGSAFGNLGDISPRNQRMFDALLYHRLKALSGAPFIWMEAESRRIGRVHLPSFLIRAKEQGIPVVAEASLSTRIRRIMETYRCDQNNPDRFQCQVAGALSRIERRLPPPQRQMLHHHLKAQRYDDLVKILLESYYDPRYRHTQSAYEEQARFRVCTDDLDAAVRQCQRIHQELQKSRPPQ
jgi:tRNA 2-selenouridine synthase